MAQSIPTISWSGRGEFGDTMTVNIQRDSQSYRHVLVFSFNDYILETKYGVTNMATCSLYTKSLMSRIPNNTQGTAKVICYTYDGAAQPGNTGKFIGQQTALSTIRVASTTVPTINSYELTDPNGYLTKYGAYVQGKSAIRAVINASGIYGSTVTYYKMSLGDVYDTGSDANTVQIDSIPRSGDIKVTLTVNDSRGRYQQVSTSVKAAAYTSPMLTNLTAKRWNASTSSEDDESSTVRVTGTASVCDVNGAGKNDSTLVIATAPYDTETWTTRTTIKYTGGGDATFSYDVSGLDANSRHRVRLTLTDSFGVVAQSVLVVETADTVLDILSNGNGLALFGVSTRDGFEVYGDSYLDGNVSVDGALSAGSARVDGNVTVGGNLGIRTVSGINVQGYQGSTTQYREIARSTLPYNSTGASGQIRVYGSLGGYGIDSRGYFDVFMTVRGGMASNSVKVIDRDPNINYGCCDLIISTDSSGYHHVYIKLPANNYYTYHVVVEGFQFTSPMTLSSSVNGTYWALSQTTEYGVQEYTLTTFARNHIYLNNNVALAGITNTGAVTSLLRVNTTGQVELGWTSGGLRGRVAKKIWSGSWTSGSITVSEAPYYNLFAFGVGNDSNQDWWVVAFANAARTGDSQIYLSFWGFNQSGQHLYNPFRININGTRLTMAARAGNYLLTDDLVHQATQASKIHTIYGLL